MYLMLMRHGEAESTAASDSDRRLTPYGQQQVSDCADNLRQQSIRVDRIAASPYRRAKETAEIMSAEFRLAIACHDELTPDSNPADVISLLDRDLASGIESSAGGLLVVTHQPLVGRLVYMMTGEEVPMRTANLAIIETQTGSRGFGELVCML